MNVSKDGKTLYFSDEEIGEALDGEKKVFVTKRINGQESHVKAEKTKKNKSKQRENAEQKKASYNSFNFDDEIVIGVDRKNTEQNNNKSRKDNNKEQVKKQINKNKHKKAVTNKKAYKKKQKKSHKNLMAIISIIILIIVVIILALMTPLFNITDIQVEGNETVSEATILSLSRFKRRRKYI